MAVQIFRSTKMSNFGGIFFAIVHLFRLGGNGFGYSKFLSIDSCEIYAVPRGVQRNLFSKHLFDAHPTAYYGPFTVINPPWKRQDI